MWGNVRLVNMNPNIEYPMKNFDGTFYRIFKNSNKEIFLHDDGWLEVTVDMDSLPMAVRLAAKIEDYRKIYLPYYHFSTLR